MENVVATSRISHWVENEWTRLRLPSRPDCIDPTVDYLKHRALLCGACSESRAAKLVLALHEALTNSIVHGNLEISSALKEHETSEFTSLLAHRAADPHYAKRTVEITIDYDGERCEWILADQGQGFDVAKVLQRDPTDEDGLWLASGRGILLMRAMMDGVRYEEGGRHAILTMQRETCEEKRREPRMPAQRPVRVAPVRDDGAVDWNAGYEALVRNVSRDGLGLLQSRLAVSDRIIIGIEADGHTLYIPAEVRHCRSLARDAVEIGCRFRTQSSVLRPDPRLPKEEAVADAIGQLIDQFQSPPTPDDERREHPRVSYTERIGLVGVHEGQPTIAFARDLSKSGMAFITNAPLPIEALTLALPHARVPRCVRVQVVRCTKIVEGFFDIGARFLEMASPEA